MPSASLLRAVVAVFISSVDPVALRRQRKAPNCGAWPRTQIHARAQTTQAASLRVPLPRRIAARGGSPARFGPCESIMEARLCGTTAVRHWRLWNRQDGAQTIAEADVKEHPLAQHPKHLARFQINHKQCLSALEFPWIFAFEADTGNDGAFMVTETNSEAHQFVRANDLAYRPNGAHSNVNLFCYGKRNGWLNWSRRHFRHFLKEIIHFDRTLKCAWPLARSPSRHPAACRVNVAAGAPDMHLTAASRRARPPAQRAELRRLGEDAVNARITSDRLQECHAPPAVGPPRRRNFPGAPAGRGQCGLIPEHQ